MKDAALEAALREALSADSIHGALRTAAVFRPPLGEADALESAVAELHGRVLSAYQSATTAVSKSRQSKEAYDGDPAPPAPPDAYNVRVNFTRTRTLSQQGRRRLSWTIRRRLRG